jgi:hypothetical protein
MASSKSFMSAVPHLVGACTVLLIVASTPGTTSARKDKDKPAVPTIRWTEGQPGCTFTRGDDGKYRYGLWTDDLGITLAVDSQELQKVRRRPEPMFGVSLTLRYRGTGALEVRNDNLSLEFVTHYHVMHSSLDPDDLSTRLQKGAEALSDEMEREIRKHPEKKAEQQVLLQSHEKDVTELQEFLSTHSLRPVRLDPGNPEVSGWVFFSTRSKWIGDWKRREDFVLRVPFANRAFEFPFSLPPSEGDLILRRRPD